MWPESSRLSHRSITYATSRRSNARKNPRSSVMRGANRADQPVATTPRSSTARGTGTHGWGLKASPKQMTSAYRNNTLPRILRIRSPHAGTGRGATKNARTVRSAVDGEANHETRDRAPTHRSRRRGNASAQLDGGVRALRRPRANSTAASRGHVSGEAFGHERSCPPPALDIAHKAPLAGIHRPREIRRTPPH